MKNNKLIKFLIVFCMVGIITLPNVYLNAASASITGGGTVNVNSSTYISISVSAPGGFYQGTAVSENSSIASVSQSGFIVSAPDDSQTANPPSTSIKVYANAVGRTRIEVNVTGEDFNGVRFSQTTFININVVAPSTGGGSSSGGGSTSGGGSSSGGGSTSSGGGSTSSGGGSTSSGGNTILDRPSDVETEDERVAREEREAEEKKALEAKVPLVSSIEVVSKSDKKRDKTLVDLEVEAESYEYSYELPSFVEDVSLKVNVVEGASVDYDADHSVTEEKVVKIKVTKGDIVQEYSLTLNPSSYEFVETDDGVVYQDESLDEVFKGYGFELKDIERDSKKMRMFSKDKLNLQMVMNDDKSVVFHRLSDEGVFEEKGQLLFEDEDVLFVKMQAPEGFENESLKGSKFKSITLPEYEFLTDVDESLLKTVDAQGWSYDENQKVVHALNPQLESDLYNIDESNNIKMAVLSFDHKSPILFYGLLVTVILLLCSLILNGILFKKNRSLNHI